MSMSLFWRVLVFASLLVGGLGCTSQTDPMLASTVAAHDAALREMPRDFYRPGLGDLMHSLQLRHSKLWFAGTADNWELAAFESHELHENFDRVARWHGDNEDIPMAPALKAYMQVGHYAVDQSIAKQDRASFEAAFDRFTAGCNQCHQAAKHEFIVIRRPALDPVGNQEWQPSRKPEN